MIIYITCILFLISSCTARPNTDVGTQNVISVPPNCPNGQELINGECREVWRRSVTAAPVNVITVPPNCPPGQQYINGQCRDVWLRNANQEENIGETYGKLDLESKNVRRTSDDSRNVVVVPPNCPPGQQLINGQCREVWRSSSNAMETFLEKLRKIMATQAEQLENADSPKTSADFDIKNIIDVPNQCPDGYRPDALGICRPIISSNAMETFLEKLRKIMATQAEQLENADSPKISADFDIKNIINVPNQCPAGYRPDALGICRPIM